MLLSYNFGEYVEMLPVFDNNPPLPLYPYAPFSEPSFLSLSKKVTPPPSFSSYCAGAARSPGWLVEALQPRWKHTNIDEALLYYKCVI